jgi:hypothetical protein
MAIEDQPPAGSIGAASPGGSNPLGLPEAEDLLAQEQLEAAAQRALEERPSLGIRTRITGGFLLMLVLITGITVTSWVLLSSVERKLQLLVLVDRLTSITPT